ncbi:hypothetical protein [Zooshikella ganghwensis]|uniref:Uncharacterized protein n=1 Tax=Zooshikella ganghwensis TaxID=202772 RepID=A0A4P9VG19_9GAMM|nr:hypothetical protein [Zooshikella ganghwensis]RDH42078.1 hypothetical protein B9G39_00710 [Zooshikella ganghwensis]
MTNETITQPTLNGDLQLEQKSLVAARIFAVKQVLGDTTANKEDEQLLEIANDIHYKAGLANATQLEKDESVLLYNQESLVWAKNNDFTGLLGNDNTEKRLQAFKDSWSLALEPPILPLFKSRTQLAEEEVNRRYPDENYAAELVRPKIRADLSTKTLTKQQVIRRYKNDPSVLHKYYDQFSNYISQNLERYVSGKTSSILNKNGVKWTLRDEPFQAVWKITKVTEKVETIPMPGSVSGRHIIDSEVIDRLDGESFLFKGADGHFGLVKPDGNLYFYPNTYQESQLIQNNIPTELAIRSGLAIPKNVNSLDINVECERLSIDGSLKRAWQIPLFIETVKFKYNPMDRLNVNDFGKTQKDIVVAGGLSDSPSILFETKFGYFGLVRPDNSIFWYDKDYNPLVKGDPGYTSIAIALNLKPSEKHIGWKRDFYPVNQLSSTVEESRINQHAHLNSLKKVIEHNTSIYYQKVIRQWKTSHYQADGFELFCRAIIPFYEVIHNEIFDQDYNFEFKDIALDVADLAFTLATIGVGAVGGVKAIRAAITAAKTLQGASRVAKASAAIRTLLKSTKTSSFLRRAGKELTDFVLPVFTAKNAATTVTRAGVSGTTSLVTRLRTVLKVSDESVDLLGPSSRFVFGEATNTQILDHLYSEVVNLAGKHVHVPSSITLARLKASLQEGANRSIPDTLYRGQSGAPSGAGLPRALGAAAPTTDEFLVDLIKHTSNSGGSGGKSLSLSSDASLARSVANNRPSGRVYKIDTTQNPDMFRSIEDILIEEGPRLVKEGKLPPGRLKNAIIHVYSSRTEQEIFYMGGDIPAEIVEMMPWRPINEQSETILIQDNSNQLVQSMASFTDKSSDSSGVSVDLSRTSHEAVSLPINNS